METSKAPQCHIAFTFMDPLGMGKESSRSSFATLNPKTSAM